MFVFLTILMVIVSLFVILIILIQNPKGSGLTGGFAGAASNIIGVQRTGDVLEKATWGSIGLLLFVAFLTVFFVPKGEKVEKTKLKTEQLMTVPSAPQGVKPTTPGKSQPDQSPAGQQPQPLQAPPAE